MGGESLFWILVPLDAFLFAAVIVIIAINWPKREEDKGKINWRAKDAWMFILFGLIALALREVFTLVEQVVQMRGLDVSPALMLIDEIPALFAAVFFIFATLILFKSKE